MKKLDQERKKLRINLEKIMAKAKKGNSMFKNWKRDEEEWKQSSF